MKTLIVIVPLLLGIIALAYTIVASLLRVWLNHRVKMVLLEKLQEDPERHDGLQNLRELVNEDAARGRAHRFIDHVVVGVTLAALGTVSALAAWFWGRQGWLAGAYLGGVACVAVGFILTLLGLMTRYLERLPIGPDKE